MPRKPPTSADDRPERERVYRYWVEIRELESGHVRNLPLRAFTRISLAGRKGDPPPPSEEFLKLEDGTTSLEAKDLDDLVAQLRLRYPDGKYERFLRSQRDLEAEERRARAIDSLIEILAKAAADDFLRSSDGQSEAPTEELPIAPPQPRRRSRSKTHV